MSPTVVIMHPIPPLWGQHFCAFGECLNAATRTICAEPLRCTDQWCRQCVACDEHADTMASLVYQMLNHPERGIVEPEAPFGGHD